VVVFPMAASRAERCAAATRTAAPVHERLEFAEWPVVTADGTFDHEPRIGRPGTTLEYSGNKPTWYQQLTGKAAIVRL
jgi:hypothetical protein